MGKLYMEQNNVNGIAGRLGDVSGCLDILAGQIDDCISPIYFYRGYGIHTVYWNLQGIARNLRSCADDIDSEKRTLEQIRDLVLKYEQNAYNILDGKEVKDYKEYAEDNTSVSGVSTYDAIKEALDFFFQSASAVSSFLGFLDKLYEIDAIGDISDYLGGISIFKYFAGVIDSFKDFNIDKNELLEIIDGSVGAFKDFADIVKDVCDIEDMKKVVSGSLNWGEVIEWLPLVGVITSTLTGWSSKYDEYNSDGKITVDEGCRLAAYGSFKGLISIAENIPIFGKLISVADTGSKIAGYDVADEITDSIFDGIDSIGERAEADMMAMIYNNDDYYEWYLNASKFERMVSYFVFFSTEANRPIIEAVSGK